MYRLIKPILFKLDPEKAHTLTFFLFKVLVNLPLIGDLIENTYSFKDPRLWKTVAGLKFKNPVGLAAGFDKNANMVDEFSLLGFGFIEIGTVTPLPQAGNEKPRLFRLKDDHALINRMGFNNVGVDLVYERLKRRRNFDCIIGGNIGKNKNTPNENAFDDYKICFEKLFDVVDYFVVNVSSPNTPGLRELQDKEPLKKIVGGLQNINQSKSEPKPIFLKIAPDLTDSQLDDIVEIVNETKIAGVVATNTTIARDNLTTNVESVGNGGLSGKPLTQRSTEVIRYLSQKSNKAFAIIGVGGIHSPEDGDRKNQSRS
jgi:dihydroorotate dehydrogenase